MNCKMSIIVLYYFPFAHIYCFFFFFAFLRTFLYANEGIVLQSVASGSTVCPSAVMRINPTA